MFRLIAVRFGFRIIIIFVLMFKVEIAFQKQSQSISVKHARIFNSCLQFYLINSTIDAIVLVSCKCGLQLSLKPEIQSIDTLFNILIYICLSSTYFSIGNIHVPAKNNMVVRYCVNMPSFEIKRCTLIFWVVKYTTVFVLFIRQKLKALKVKI